MKRCILFLFVLGPVLALPVEGSIFSKKPRAKKEGQASNLINTAKNDPDEEKRIAAITEMRDMDAQANAQIIPTLIDLLQNDTRPAVRREAASALSRVRPGTPAAQQALQQAASKDPSLRVRIQAWSSYKMFQMGGPPKTKEPQPTTPTVKRPTTDEPPLYDGDEAVTAEPRRPPVTPPAPKGPAVRDYSAPAAPTPPRKFAPPPVIEEGPILAPPK